VLLTVLIPAEYKSDFRESPGYSGERGPRGPVARLQRHDRETVTVDVNEMGASVKAQAAGAAQRIETAT
jgi:hypothetical protein